MKEFDLNQNKIDRIIKKVNNMRMDNNFDTSSLEGRKKVHKGYTQIEKLKAKQNAILKKKLRAKRFYFNPIKKSHSIYGGTYYTAPIYKHSKKGMVKVSEAKWNTASTSGEESEVLQQLVRDKILPKEVLALSRGVSSGSGYYHWGMRDSVGLDIRKL